MARTLERQDRIPVDVQRCIAIEGKGLPAGAVLEEAIEAAAAAAAALATAKRKVGHLFRPEAPELHLSPVVPGQRGSARWRVLVRVPAFVTARDVCQAAAAAARRRPAAKAVRLVPVGAPAPRGAARPGRDRLPGAIRKTRGGPQHRARESLR